MRQILLFFSLLFLSFEMLAQPLQIQDMVQEASLIVEGKISSKHSFWDEKQGMIYTSYQLKVFRNFRPENPLEEVNFICTGGTVGNDRIEVSPSLEMKLGQEGIFFLKEKILDQKAHYELVDPLAAFILYDPVKEFAGNINASYSIKELSALLQKETGIAPLIIQERKVPRKNSSRAAGPQILSFFPDSLAAGVGDTLSIVGTGFGALRDTSAIAFSYSGDGGSTYRGIEDIEYISWSDTLVKVLVNYLAGTGLFTVTVEGITAESASELYIPYSQRNIVYTGEPFQQYFYDVDGLGGYTLHLHAEMDSVAAAKKCLNTALKKWACATGMNWRMGDTTHIDYTGKDGTSTIRFDNGNEIPANYGGFGYTYSNFCTVAGEKQWYIQEFDIVFNDDVNWYYGDDFCPNAAYDFMTITMHEMGHLLQLGHVNDPKDLMYYQILSKTTKRYIVENNITGCAYKIQASADAPKCGFPSMTAYAGDCSGLPVANFEVEGGVVCNGVGGNFNNTSTGSIDTVYWKFVLPKGGELNVENPRGVTFILEGDTEVSLIVVNADGFSQVTKSVLVTDVDITVRSTAKSCATTEGNASVTINQANLPSTILWSNGATTANNAVMDKGTYTVTVTGAYGCKVSDSVFVDGPAPYDYMLATTASTCKNDGSISFNDAGVMFSSFNINGDAVANSPVTDLAPGNYSLVLSSFVCEESINFEIVNEELDVSVAVDNATGECRPTVTGGVAAYTYNWMDPVLFNDEIIILDSSGTYSLEVTDAANCKDTASFVFEFIPTNITDEEQVTFRMYPNPTAGIVQLFIPGEGGELRITDNVGKQVFKQQLIHSLNSLDISALENGIYYLQVNHSIRQKLIKVN